MNTKTDELRARHIVVLQEMLREYEGDEPGPMGFSEERAALEAAIAALARQEEGREAVLERPARVAGRDFMPGQPMQQVVGRAEAHFDAHYSGATDPHPAPPSTGEGDALEPIERDALMERDYIPLPGGWEVQTKGKGSTFRLCAPGDDPDRYPVTDRYLQEALTQMAHAIRVAWHSHRLATPTPQSGEAGAAVETIKRIAAQLAEDDCHGDAADLIDALHALSAPASPQEVSDAVPLPPRCFVGLGLLKGANYEFGKVYDSPDGEFIRWADFEKYRAALKEPQP